MRRGTFGDHANATTLENEAKFVANFITDGTMETEPSPAVYKVASISYERYTIKTWLEGARCVLLEKRWPNKKLFLASAKLMLLGLGRVSCTAGSSLDLHEVRQDDQRGEAA